MSRYASAQAFSEEADRERIARRARDLADERTASASLTEAIIADRQNTHGDYAKMAETTCRFIEASIDARPEGYPPAQLIAINMIFVKLARIICGDLNHRDHWDDIAGYATLASRACVGSDTVKKDG